MPATDLPQALRAALLAEAEASARYNAEVASRWAALYDVEVPQELYEQTERQQQLCCRVIANKQDLIAGEGLQPLQRPWSGHAALQHGAAIAGQGRRAGSSHNTNQLPFCARDLLRLLPYLQHACLGSMAVVAHQPPAIPAASPAHPTPSCTPCPPPAEIRGELLRKDEAYVKLLKRQGEEVDGLLVYMAAQYNEMQAGYREELDAVERAFLMVGGLGG